MQLRKVALLVFMLVGLYGMTAHAEDDVGLSEGPFVRQQFIYRGMRHEITPTFGATLNDAFLRNYMLGLRYQYHINNWLGAGVTASYNLCSALGGDTCNTALADEVVNRSVDISELTAISRIDFMLAPHFSLVPITGKFGFTWFGKWAKVLNYDLHLLVGAAIVGLSNGGQGVVDMPSGDLSKFNKTTLGPMVGIGQRFFISDWMAINVEVRDYMIKRTLNAVVDEGSQDRAAEEKLQNNFMVNIGLNLYFPNEVTLSR